jgi:hypothetical protein
MRVRVQVPPLLRIALQLALRAPSAHLQVFDNFSQFFPTTGEHAGEFGYEDAFDRVQRMIHASVAAFPAQLLIFDYPSCHDLKGSWSPAGSCSWHLSTVESETTARLHSSLRLQADTRE